MDYPFTVRQNISESITTIVPEPVSNNILETITTIVPEPVSRSVVETLNVVNQTLSASVAVSESLVVVEQLRVRFTYSGTLCADRLNGYARVVDDATGEVVWNHYIPSSDEFAVVLEVGRRYSIVLPSSGDCAVGSCEVSYSRAYIDGRETTNTTIKIIFTASTTVEAVYEVTPVIRYAPAIVVARSGSIYSGTCPDGSDRTCYWFDGSIALSLACSLIGETKMDVYEFQHDETIRILYDGNLLLELQPYTRQQYRVIPLKIRSPCRMYLVALSASCRVLHMDVEMKPVPQVKVPAPTIIVPRVELSAPEITSPSGLVMFGSLVGLFLFMSKKTRWTHAMFTVSIILAVGGMVVFQSPQIFVVGILMALVAIVLDRYV